MIAGQAFPIQSNDEILKIKSPQSRLSGPYVVVIKNVNKRWAIVALRWDNNRNGLGIRWFHGQAGNPFSRQSTWLIIPEELQEGVINLLQSDTNKNALRKFLNDNNSEGYLELQQQFVPEQLNKQKI